jgi:hypothetical protein
MSMNLEELEIHRRRWRRVRALYELVDPLSDTFGTGGLARHAPQVHVRFLILPADPEATIAEFDEAFWEWWMGDRPNPFEGASITNWGEEAKPEASAAVRLQRWRGDPWSWDSYLALHRSGGLEFGLGSAGSVTWHIRDQADEIRVFLLTTIVGRIWWVLAQFREVIDRYELQQPWEVTLALRDSHMSVLGNVAAGWAEPNETYPFEEAPRCPDPNVLIVRELAEWPDAKGAQALAFSVGANIEDAFGFSKRRFLARLEPDAGAFDTSRYRSGG